jgi:hypothetical protein
LSKDVACISVVVWCQPEVVLGKVEKGEDLVSRVGGRLGDDPGTVGTIQGKVPYIVNLYRRYFLIKRASRKLKTLLFAASR